MKKNILLLFMSASLSLMACAQQKEKEDHEKVEVPAVVKAAFDKHYPGITPEWENEDGNYEAGFKKEGKEMSALFDAHGQFLESEAAIAKTALPAAAQTYIQSHYKGQRIRETAKITKADGTVNYEAEIKGKDVLFDVNGKFLRVAAD